MFKLGTTYSNRIKLEDGNIGLVFDIDQKYHSVCWFGIDNHMNITVLWDREFRKIAKLQNVHYYTDIFREFKLK